MGCPRRARAAAALAGPPSLALPRSSRWRAARSGAWRGRRRRARRRTTAAVHATLLVLPALRPAEGGEVAVRCGVRVLCCSAHSSSSSIKRVCACLWLFFFFCTLGSLIFFCYVAALPTPTAVFLARTYKYIFIFAINLSRARTHHNASYLPRRARPRTDASSCFEPLVLPHRGIVRVCRSPCIVVLQRASVSTK